MEMLFILESVIAAFRFSWPNLFHVCLLFKIDELISVFVWTYHLCKSKKFIDSFINKKQECNWRKLTTYETGNEKSTKMPSGSENIPSLLTEKKIIIFLKMVYEWNATRPNLFLSKGVVEGSFDFFRGF